MNRAELLRDVGRALGHRRLVWAGIRGDDVEPLTDLPNLDASYSIIGAYRRRSSVSSLAYEDLSGERVDLETWDIDDNLDTEAATTFRRTLLRALARPSALLPYRPSPFLSAIWFARRDRSLNLGLFGGHQSAFEHKPWVETSLAALGVPVVPWTYVADEDQLRTRDVLGPGSLVLRRSRTSGGEGFVFLDEGATVEDVWPHAHEGFVSVAPYIEDALPVNIGATVWADGVTLHHPSVQLIGIPGCVTRRFGYCGNDFGLAASLDDEVLNRIEETTTTVGHWLRTFGYRGTFGVDFLVHDGEPLFTEVNARFQGSTHASCRLAIAEGESCLILEHVAAMLGLPAPPSRSLRSMVASVPPLANLVVHWTGDAPAALDGRALTTLLGTGEGTISADTITHPGLLTHPGGVVARVTVRDVLTRTGYEVDRRWADPVATWSAAATASIRPPG